MRHRLPYLPLSPVSSVVRPLDVGLVSGRNRAEEVAESVMRLFLEAILDKMEPFFTKRKWGRHKPPPKWLQPMTPDWDLRPTEFYSTRLYLRNLQVTFLPTCIWMIMGWLLPLMWLWHEYPGFMRRALLHRGRAHTLLVGLLAHLGYYQVPLPLLLLFLLAFCLTLFLPYRFFWNRRALRLRSLTPASGEGVEMEAVLVDQSVWPPAPNLPAV